MPVRHGKASYLCYFTNGNTVVGVIRYDHCVVVAPAKHFPAGTLFTALTGKKSKAFIAEYRTKTTFVEDGTLPLSSAESGRRAAAAWERFRQSAREGRLHDIPERVLTRNLPYYRRLAGLSGLATHYATNYTMNFNHSTVNFGGFTGGNKI